MEKEYDKEDIQTTPQRDTHLRDDFKMIEEQELIHHLK